MNRANENRNLRFLSSEMSDMNITPPSSPPSRSNGDSTNQTSQNTPSFAVTSPTKPIAFAPKYNMTSPTRRSQGYQFIRTHSSPSIIDASPKRSSQEPGDTQVMTLSPPSFFPAKGFGIGTHRSELTPVTRNTDTNMEGRTQTDGSRIPPINHRPRDNDATIASLFVPEARFLQRRGTDAAETRNVPTNEISRNPVTIRPRKNVPDLHNQLLNPPPPPPLPTRIISPLPLVGREEVEEIEEVEEVEEDQYTPSTTGALLTRSIPFERNCYSLTNSIGSIQECADGIEAGLYAVPPSSPTSPPHGVRDAILQRNQGYQDENLPPQEYMIPYQPSRDSSLASFGVVTEDVGGIFLAPRRRRKQRQPAPPKRGDYEEEDGDESMDMNMWDTSGRTGGDDDGSIASSSIPSIRMAIRLTDSSSISYNDDNISLGMDSYLDREDDMDYQHYLERQDHHVPFRQSMPRPLEMAVTPSPPRRSGRSFFDNGMVSSKSNRGGEASGQDEVQQMRNGALEWLKTVEVGRNNQYVAEAASSKFLTGKRIHHTNGLENTDCDTPLESAVGSRNGAVMTKERNVHSTVSGDPNTMTMTARQPTSGGPTVGGVAKKPEGNRVVQNYGRKQVYGRSLNMLGTRGGNRGTKRVSRLRASAMMR